MKKALLKVLIVLFISPLMLQAQNTYTASVDSWSLGFGVSYPRWFSSNLRPLESNYGAFVYFERGFTEHSGLRLKGYYRSILGRIPGGIYKYPNGTLVPSLAEEARTNIYGADLSYLYYFVPCEKVSPYFFAGGGAEYSVPDWGNVVTSADDQTTFYWLAGGGVKWTLSPDWELTTELGLMTVASTVEGIVNNNRQGLFGSNTSSYMSVDFGLSYYLDKGEPSKYCQCYSGINYEPQADIDYDRIESIVQKHIPQEVVKEVVVQVPTENVEDNWVLIGCTFDVNKYTLRPEAYPILLHAAQVLLNHRELNIEIQGYTDAVGSNMFNQKLSEKRASAVKNFLVARGINESRITAKGYGSENPIATNDTPEGRALNRRIEFKVIK